MGECLQSPAQNAYQPLLPVYAFDIISIAIRPGTLCKFFLCKIGDVHLDGRFRSACPSGQPKEANDSCKVFRIILAQ